MSDYSQYPKSVTELKADKTGYAGDWTGRDVLLCALREIDSGTDVEFLTVLYREKLEDGNVITRFITSAPSAAEFLGLVEMAKHRYLTND